MESSSSQGDIKALSVESKQDVTDAANTIEVAAAETVTRKSVEENPAQISVSVGGDDESNVLEDVSTISFHTFNTFPIICPKVMEIVKIRISNCVFL